MEKQSVDVGDPKVLGLIIGAGLGVLASKKHVSRFIDTMAGAAKKGAVIAIPLAGAVVGATIGGALKSRPQPPPPYQRTRYPRV